MASGGRMSARRNCNVDVQVGRGRPGAGSAGRAAPAAGLGQDCRARCPARHRHVRGDVRLPDHHGAQPQPRDPDERDRHDLLPADRQGQGAELPRHVRLLRRRSQRHLCAERRTGRRHRRDPGLRRRARAGRRADPRTRRGRGQPGAAAGRHRRRGHADRLQPGRGGHRHLPPGRPVDRPADDARGDPDGRGAARLRRPDRDLPRPDLRLRRVLARRRGVRPDHLGDPVVRRRGRSPTTGSTGRWSRPPSGSASRARPPTGSSATRDSSATSTPSAGTCRRSR